MIKRIILKIIANNFTGAIIKVLMNNSIRSLKYGNLRFICSSDLIDKTTIARIFLGAYESSEIRFIRKYINAKFDVIELGSSLGIVSCHIGKLIEKRRLICVEAIPEYSDIIRENLDANSITNYKIVSSVVNAKNEQIVFQRGKSNVHGHISYDNSSKGYKIQSRTLSSILNEYNIKEYVLVCDIEGAEVPILLHNSDALSKCKMIIIETHKITYDGVEYTPENIKEIILRQGFELIDSYGVNFVFKRR